MNDIDHLSGCTWKNIAAQIQNSFTFCISLISFIGSSGLTRSKSLKMTRISIKKRVSSILRDYAEASTAHGISYVFDKNLLGIEKLLWFMVCVSFITMAAIFSCQAYHKWQDDPIITSVKTTGMTDGP